MKVTVIVPAYNATAYIEQCVDSILSQSHPHIEVVAVDDGSTDDTLQTLKRMADRDSRLQVVHTANHGPGAARNVGIAHATGEAVAFVDADDMVHPDFVAAMVERLGGDCDIAMCAMVSGPVLKAWPTHTKGTVTMSGMKAAEASLYQRGGIDCSFSAKLFRRSLLDADTFQPGIRYEDLEAFHRVCARARSVAVLGRRMYFYRTHSVSFMRNFTPERLDVLSVVASIERHWQGTSLAKASRDRAFAANYNMAVLADGESREASRKAWAEVKRLRAEVLLNPKSRMKNKAGAVLSLLGRRAVVALAKSIYKCR